MSARTDGAWNELNANSYRKQDLDEQIMDMKADRYWVKKQIVETIKAVGHAEHQTLLEKRYLCFMTFEQIAEDMSYSVNNIFKMHKKALLAVKLPEPLACMAENYSEQVC